MIVALLVVVATVTEAPPDVVRVQARVARERQSLKTAKALFEAAGQPAEGFDRMISAKDGELLPAARKLLEQWPKTRDLYAQDEYVVKIRDKEIRTQLTSASLSGASLGKRAMPNRPGLTQASGPRRYQSTSLCVDPAAGPVWNRRLLRSTSVRLMMEPSVHSCSQEWAR